MRVSCDFPLVVEGLYCGRLTYLGFTFIYIFEKINGFVECRWNCLSPVLMAGPEPSLTDLAFITRVLNGIMCSNDTYIVVVLAHEQPVSQAKLFAGLAGCTVASTAFVAAVAVAPVGRHRRQFRSFFKRFEIKCHWSKQSRKNGLMGYHQTFPYPLSTIFDVYVW